MLDKSFVNQGEYVTFPGVPGRYRGGQPVPLSQTGLSLEEMRELVKETGAPLKETTGPELDNEALYGAGLRMESEGGPATTRDAGRYPGLNAEESDARDAVAAKKKPTVAEATMLDEPRADTEEKKKDS